MRQALRFAVALVVGLALLTWGASSLVSRTTRAWFEKDMQLRAHLAVGGAHEALVSRWPSGQEAELRKVLVELTHDERVLGAAACGADFSLKARTPDYPPPLWCATIGARVRPPAESPDAGWTTWSSVFSAAGGHVHATAVPLLAETGQALGFVVLVHDLSFVERREETTRTFLGLAFGFLALAASVITLAAARLSWRGWSNEMRRLVRGEMPRPEFRPFLRDVRDLVERLAAERETEGQGGLWTAERLKNTLSRHLHGERVVIVANREPYIHEQTSDGGLVMVHPASGLVTALEPVMRACSGVWVAHGGGSADREASDKRGRLRVPPGEESYVLRRVWLSAEEEKGYYYGFSNEGLWPLCHIADTRPAFRSEDWRHYQEVNRKFAEAVAEEVDSDDPILLVQDYHFALLPRMIREKLPRATVITFWHIPWPNSERFGICPWREEILAGLLGSSILGFHTQFHCNNFMDGVDRFLECAHRPGAERGRPPGPADPRPAVPDLDRVAEHVGRVRPAGGRVPCRRLRRAGSRAGRAPRRGRRPPRLHEGHRGAAACGGAAARAHAGAARALHVRAARRAEPDDDPPVPPAERRRGTRRRASQRSLRRRLLPPHGAHARAPRAPERLPLLSRRGRLLREQPARRHEPRREGVRRGARGRAGSARPQPLHRRRPRADGGPRS